MSKQHESACLDLPLVGSSGCTELEIYKPLLYLRFPFFLHTAFNLKEASKGDVYPAVWRAVVVEEVAKETYGGVFIPKSVISK
jgi:hypothetical protein